MNYSPNTTTNPQYYNPFDYSGLAPKELFTVLQKYYDNDPYSDIELSRRLEHKWMENMRGLKSPARRSVEFFASHLLKGYQVTSPNAKLKTAIDLILQWSNFSNMGKVAIRQDSLFGQAFFKCMSDGEKVWFELLDPITIGDNFEVDNKGYIKSIRIDSWFANEEGRNILNTEYYEKTDSENGYFSVWQSESNQETTKLEELTGLVDTGFLRELVGDNFVPILYCKFSDIGKKLGVGCVEPYLAKIDELNRMSTALHEMIFNNKDGLWVVSANDKDASGRPIPAPKPKLAIGTSYGDEPKLKELKNVVALPGLVTMNCLIPNLPYDSMLAIVNDQLKELEYDMPELKYNALSESQLSSKAIRLMLAGAIDKAEEARESLLSALKRAIQICLTMGSFFTLPDFLGLGTFENGNFDDFTITCEEIFPMSDDEKALTLKTYVEAGLPLPTAMRKSGFSEDEILLATQEKQAQDKQTADTKNQSLAGVMSNFNTGV
jgi:hypothetical protein